MFDRLQAVEDRYEKLNDLLSDPDVISDTKKLREYSKEQSDIQPTVECYREYTSVKEQIRDAKGMLEEKLDAEMREMVKEELNDLEHQEKELAARLQILLLPKDPNDDKNVIMEIRGAAGGDEAALFAGDLFRMYSRYAETQGWRIEIIDSNSTGVGGYKEIIFMINGNGA
ncbi:MAG: PCRF domain-containing protein, partial [Bacilli bacterium]